MRELESVSHRPYCSGFFFDDPMENAQICDEDGTRIGYIREKSYIATVQSFDMSTMTARCIQKNKLTRGDSFELISPGKCGLSAVAEKMFSSDGKPIESAPHPYMEFDIVLPFEAKAGDIIRR